LEAAEAYRYREKLDQLDILLTSSTPRDKKGVNIINRKVGGFEREYRSRLFIDKEESYDDVWSSIHKSVGRQAGN